jgi:dipeptide transport system permease protein
MNRTLSLLTLILRKIALLLPTVFGTSLLAFLLIRLVPGDPVTNLLGERGGDPQVVAQMQAKLGLDLPLWQQYGRFVSRALQMDLGESITSKISVTEEFFARFPATLELSLVAMLWASLVAIPLGILAALRKNSALDYGIVGISTIGYSMPIFWWGLVLIMFFSVQLGWLPVSGRVSVMYDIPPVSGFFLIDSWYAEEPWAAFKSSVQHLVLPALALGTIPLAALTRMTRSSMLEVLSEDYIRAAKAKGFSWTRVIYRHALRNALIPLLTVFGLLFGALLTGAVLTETIFSWPGVGRWLYKSVEARDYPVVQGAVVILAVLITLVNLIVDLLYLWAYPRLRKAT